MATTSHLTVPIDAYDPDSPLNFPVSTLLPASLPPPTTSTTIAQAGTQIRQLLRSGDTPGALAAVLDAAPLGGDAGAKQAHLVTVMEVLQGTRQSDVGRVLGEVLGDRQRGMERGGTLMKYIYRGMEGGIAKGARDVSPQTTGTGSGFSQIQARSLGAEGGGQAMSVLLSWHEKLVEIVGVGGIVRVMCDRRTV